MQTTADPSSTCNGMFPIHFHQKLDAVPPHRCNFSQDSFSSHSYNSVAIIAPVINAYFKN